MIYWLVFFFLIQRSYADGQHVLDNFQKDLNQLVGREKIRAVPESFIEMVNRTKNQNDQHRMSIKRLEEKISKIKNEVDVLKDLQKNLANDLAKEDDIQERLNAFEGELKCKIK